MSLNARRDAKPSSAASRLSGQGASIGRNGAHAPEQAVAGAGSGAPDAFAMVDAYRRDFEALVRTGTDGVPAVLDEARRSAMSRFGELGFPSTRDEAWRFTNVAPIAAVHFGRPLAALSAENEAALRQAVESHALPGALRLVFVNGRWRPDLSSDASVAGDIPSGAVIGSLRQACADGHAAANAHFARYVPADQPFAALGRAFVEDGAFVYLPAGAVMWPPIHLIHLSTAGTSTSTLDGRPLISSRTLVVAEARSAATVIETFAGVGHGERLILPVAEIVAGDEVDLVHVTLQDEPADAYHLASLNLTQGRQSRVRCYNLDLGGRLARHDLSALLDGEGAEATFDGLYVLAGQQHVDNHMRVEHVKAHTSSRELYKGVLAGESRAVFNGLIYVHPGADQTDAKQSNRNLLLSDKALVNSNPQLEIFASDVKCTHGSTVGQLDEDALFYLRSRGLGAGEARGLLVSAFTGEIVDQIPVDALRDWLAERLLERLGGGR